MDRNEPWCHVSVKKQQQQIQDVLNGMTKTLL